MTTYLTNERIHTWFIESLDDISSVNDWLESPAFFTAPKSIQTAILFGLSHHKERAAAHLATLGGLASEW